MLRVFACFLLLASVAASLPAQGGTVSRGPMTFTFIDDMANPIAPSGNADLTWNGVEQLFQLWFWYRCEGDTFEQPMPPPDATFYNQNKDIVSLVWDPGIDCGGGPESAIVEIRLFDCTVDPLCQSPGPIGEVFVRISHDGGPVFIKELFTYFDFDVDDSAGGDIALPLSGGGSPIHIRDGAMTVDVVEQFGNQLPFKVTAWPVLRDELNDDQQTDLDDSGLPFAAGDFTGAYQNQQPLKMRGGAGSLSMVISLHKSIFVDGFESGDVLGWTSSSP